MPAKPDSMRSILVSGTLYGVLMAGVMTLLEKSKKDNKEIQDNKNNKANKAPPQEPQCAFGPLKIIKNVEPSEQKANHQDLRAKPFLLTEQDLEQGESMLKG